RIPSRDLAGNCRHLLGLLDGAEAAMTCSCCGCKLEEHTCLVPGCGRTFYLCTPGQPGRPSCSKGNDGRCPACRRAQAPVPAHPHTNGEVKPVVRLTRTA